MNEKKYSYLPNSYTLKFFKESEEKQQKSFKPLIIINNIKRKKEAIENNQKKVRNSENNNKKQFTEKSLSKKKNLKLMEKRKKAIDLYLSTKKNAIITTNKEKNKYINNIENYSLSSIHKNIPYNPQRKNHSFQNSKCKKKSNIISQIKNEDDSKIKKAIHYCKTDKELNIKENKEQNKGQNKGQNKEEIKDEIKEKNKDETQKKKQIDNKEKEKYKKILSINSVILKNNSQKEINKKEGKCRTSDKATKTNKIYLKDISMKDNCFNIDNAHIEKNVNSYKLSLSGEIKNKNKNDTENKETKAFKPNMDIFKNTKFNSFILNSKNSSKKEEKINKRIDLTDNKNHIIPKINNNKNNIDENNIKNISDNNKEYENKINNEKNQLENNNINFKNNNNRLLNNIEINKNPINSELSQFTFKNEIMIKDNNQNSSILADKRRKELKKLINFTNKF